MQSVRPSARESAAYTSARPRGRQPEQRARALAGQRPRELFVFFGLQKKLFKHKRYVLYCFARRYTVCYSEKRSQPGPAARPGVQGPQPRQPQRVSCPAGVVTDSVPSAFMALRRTCGSRPLDIHSGATAPGGVTGIDKDMLAVRASRSAAPRTGGWGRSARAATQAAAVRPARRRQGRRSKNRARASAGSAANSVSPPRKTAKPPPGASSSASVPAGVRHCPLWARPGAVNVPAHRPAAGRRAPPAPPHTARGPGGRRAA